MTLRLTPDAPDLVVRRIRPEDKGALDAGLARLSDRAAYQRFLSPKPRFTAAELRYLTEVDFLDHYALVAVRPDAPDRIVAVGRWVRDEVAGDRAEVAIVVADHLQGCGVGTMLGERLAEAARDRGIARFTASMLPSNAAAHRLFARISQHLEITHGHGVDEVVATLALAAA